MKDGYNESVADLISAILPISSWLATVSSKVGCQEAALRLIVSALLGKTIWSGPLCVLILYFPYFFSCC